VVYDVGTGALLDVDSVLADVLPLYGPLDEAQMEAAVAARPYSTRMSAVIGNLASAMNGQAGAPTLLTGTGMLPERVFLARDGKVSANGQLVRFELAVK
jgi:hypothetical protein